MLTNPEGKCSEGSQKGHLCNVLSPWQLAVYINSPFIFLNAILHTEACQLRAGKTVQHVVVVVAKITSTQSLV